RIILKLPVIAWQHWTLSICGIRLIRSLTRSFNQTIRTLRDLYVTLFIRCKIWLTGAKNSAARLSLLKIEPSYPMRVSGVTGAQHKLIVVLVWIMCLTRLIPMFHLLKYLSARLNKSTKRLVALKCFWIKSMQGWLVKHVKVINSMTINSSKLGLALNAMTLMAYLP